MPLCYNIRLAWRRRALTDDCHETQCPFCFRFRRRFICLPAAQTHTSSLTTPVSAQPLKTGEQPQRSVEQLLRKDFVSSVDHESHQYFLYLPRGYADQPQKRWPILLFLHGNGERGNARDELDYVISRGPLYEAWIQKKDLPFIIISPQLPMFGMDKKGIPYIDNRTRA